MLATSLLDGPAESNCAAPEVARSRIVLARRGAGAEDAAALVASGEVFGRR